MSVTDHFDDPLERADFMARAGEVQKQRCELCGNWVPRKELGAVAGNGHHVHADCLADAEGSRG